MVSQGAWQNWDDADYIDYLERYYGMQFTNAQKILKSAMMDESEALLIAVFNKIASPSVYVQPHFKAHMAKKKNAVGIAEPMPTREPKPSEYEPRTPQPDKWKPTRTEGTYMCREGDVTDGELADAKDNKDGMTWYIPPSNGYRWGLVFKKVKA